jgi:endonuclease III-like uncharacterized protein
MTDMRTTALNELWNEGILNQKRLDEINEMDLHQLMSKEEFYAKLDKAEQQISLGNCTTFDNLDEMNAWLNSL